MRTFLRRLAILDYLKRSRVPRTTGDILQHLRDADYVDSETSEPAALRLVQRDLNFLLGEVDEDGEPDNPFGLTVEQGPRRTLYWALEPWSDMRFDWERMPAFMALTLGMTGKHLAPILPAGTRDELAWFLEQAERRLSQAHRGLRPHHYGRLKDSVEFFQRGHALQAAPYDPLVLDTLYRAIILGRMLGFEYRSARGLSTYRVHVYGVAILLPKLYLVARKDDGKTLQTFLVHRIHSAWLEPGSARVDPGFNLRQWLESGEMEMYLDPADRDLYTLRLTFPSRTLRPGLLDDLRDSPISPDQTLTKDAQGNWHLTARVRRTVQLRHWLLSVADVARIDAPDCIRQDVKTLLHTILVQQKDT